MQRLREDPFLTEREGSKIYWGCVERVLMPMREIMGWAFLSFWVLPMMPVFAYFDYFLLVVHDSHCPSNILKARRPDLGTNLINPKNYFNANFRR